MLMILWVSEGTRNQDLRFDSILGILLKVSG